MTEAMAGEGAFRMDLKKYAIALLIVAAAQTAALGWIIAARVNLINTGQEVVLNIITVDPRSLFRGDYVILSYGISRLDTGKRHALGNTLPLGSGPRIRFTQLRSRARHLRVGPHLTRRKDHRPLD